MKKLITLITLITIVLLASCAKEPIMTPQAPNTLNCNLIYVKLTNTSNLHYNVNLGSITGQSNQYSVSSGDSRVMAIPLSSSVAISVYKSDGTRFVQKFDNPNPCNVYEVIL